MTEIVLTDRDFEALDNFAAFCHQESRKRGFHRLSDKLKAHVEKLAAEGDEELGGYILQMYHGNRLELINGEVTEAHEELPNGHAVDEVYIKDGKPEGYPTEIIDVFVRAFDTSKENEITVSSEMRRKLGYNSGRSPMHGGKSF